MTTMFYSVNQLSSLDLSSFTTDLITVTTNMFNNTRLDILDFRNASFNQVTGTVNMFSALIKPLIIYVKDEDAYNFIASLNNNYLNPVIVS